MFHTHETKMLCGDCHGAEGKEKTADIRKVRIRMRKYKSDQTLDRVICNGCGRKLVVEDGILREGPFQQSIPGIIFLKRTEKFTAGIFVRSVMTG